LETTASADAACIIAAASNAADAMRTIDAEWDSFVLQNVQEEVAAVHRQHPKPAW